MAESDDSAAGILDIDIPAGLPDETKGDAAKGAESDNAGSDAPEKLQADGGADPATDEPAQPPAAGTGPSDIPADPVVADTYGKGEIRQAVVVAPDATDKKFDAALAAIEADEMLTPGQKVAETLRLETLREERNERRQRNATADDDRAWGEATARHGLPRATLETMWRDLGKEYAKKYPNHDPSYYSIAMNEKFDALAAAKKPATPAPAPPPTRSTNRTPAAPPAGSVAPAAPSRNRPPVPSKDPGAEFDKSMTRDDLNALV